MRGIDLPRVPDDAINENQIFVLDDPTQSFSMTLAQLKEFIKAYLDDVFVNVNGDTMTDRLIIEKDNDGVRLQNDTQGKPIYLLCNDADGTNRFYIGVGDDTTNDVALYNYIGGGNRVTVADNGSIELSPRGVGTVVTNGIHEITGTSSSQLHFVELDTGKKYIFVCDGGNFRLDEDSTTGSNVLTWTSEGNKLFVNGRVSMFDYGEFDIRYQKVNTASKAVNAWFQDTNTGMIFQAGFNPSTNGNVSTVSFPIAFPTACVSVNNTVIYPDQGNEINMSKLQAPATLTNFIAGNDQHGSYWFAVGYSGTTGTQKDFDHLEHFGFVEPAYFYSAMNNAFYPSSLFDAYAAGDGWPDDAVMVNDETYLEYAANKPPEGKERIAGADGMPAWGDEVFLELTPAQYQAKKDALLKKAGGEIDALRDVMKYLANTEHYADSLEEWERYRAAIYVATPEEAVKIPLPE